MNQPPTKYLVDAPFAYPADYGTVDHLEVKNNAIYYMAPGVTQEPVKLIGLQSIGFLMEQLENIRFHHVIMAQRDEKV